LRSCSAAGDGDGRARVAFTIADSYYAFDMLHDVFDMAHNLMGFEGRFFLVALDAATLAAACAAGYAAIPAPGLAPLPLAAEDAPGGGAGGALLSASRLREAVQNTKFVVCKALVDAGVDLFFFEMDVLFIASPQPLFAAMTTDILLASHQNNAQSGNIGVYAARATDATREFFEDCLEFARLKPAEHDQRIFNNLVALSKMVASGQPIPKGWGDRPPTALAARPVTSAFMGPHVVRPRVI
jgi:hypothetical protein